MRRHRLVPILLSAFAVILGFVVTRHEVRQGNGKAARHETKMVLILVDGADWRIIKHLLAQGRLPTFRYLIDNGSSGQLQTVHPLSSPNDASILTGVYPRRHGVTTHTCFDPRALTKEKSEFSALKSPPLWEIFKDDYTFSLLSFVEAPEAFKVNNAMVGSLFNIKLLAAYDNLALKTPLGFNYLSWFLATKRSVYPQHMLADFKPDFLRHTADEMASRGINQRFQSPVSARMANCIIVALESVHRLILEGDRKSSPWGRFSSNLLVSGVRSVLNSPHSAKFIYDYDAVTQHLARHLIRQRRSDIYLVYFMGTDTFAHMYFLEGWKMADEGRFQEQVYRYYEVIDGYFAELIKAAEPDTTFLVLSDTGTADVAFDVYQAANNGYFDSRSPWYGRYVSPHSEKAVFIAKGPHIKRGYGDVAASVIDIVPTVHCLFRRLFPPGKYDGRILNEILEEGYQCNWAGEMSGESPLSK